MNGQPEKPPLSDPTAPAAPKAPAAPQSAPAPAKQEPHRGFAALSYLGILFLIPLLAEKDDDFVRFHLRQGIALFALDVVASFGFWHRAIGSALSFVLCIISLVAAWRAYQGRRWVLPVIGEYAQKIKL